MASGSRHTGSSSQPKTIGSQRGFKLLKLSNVSMRRRQCGLQLLSRAPGKLILADYTISFLFFFFHRRNKQSFVPNIRLPYFEGRFITQAKSMSSFRFCPKSSKQCFTLHDTVSAGSASVPGSSQKTSHFSFIKNDERMQTILSVA